MLICLLCSSARAAEIAQGKPAMLLGKPAISSELVKQLTDHRLERRVELPPDKYEPRRTRHKPIFVIHETAMSGVRAEAEATQPSYRASFHVLLRRDGTVVYMVPPQWTAYTAGFSQFNQEYDYSDSGRRTVNHFGYQVELESPEDGYWCDESSLSDIASPSCKDGGGRGATHSGYTEVQYATLAWLAVETGIPRNRITTHAAVDLSGTRTDPRSFDWDTFWAYYDAFPDRAQTVFLGNE